MSKAKSIAARSILHIIDNYDRPGRAYADVIYSEADAYAHAFTDKPGQRVPKAGAIAQAGLGRAGAEWSVFGAEAKGPNAKAEAKADPLEASAMARAEVGSATACAGPLGVTVGLGVDTGVSVGPTHAEVKLLGCGLTVGSTMGAAFFGTELSFKLW